MPMPQRLFGLLAFDCHCHLGRDKHENVLVDLAKPDLFRIGLNGHHADGLLLCLERHPQPVHWRRAEYFYLAASR
jgi:hypothetical protein